MSHETIKITIAAGGINYPLGMAIPGVPGRDGTGSTAWEEVFDELTGETLDAVVAKTDVVLDNHTLYYRQDEDKNHSLGWGYYRHGIDGPVLNGFTGVGIATGDANDTEDVLVANFDQTGLVLPLLAHASAGTKLAVIDASGKIVSEDKPEDIPFNFTNQSEWIVNHNLNKRPNITVYSVGGKEMWAETLHQSFNQSIVYFDEPTSGTAIVSQ